MVVTALDTAVSAGSDAAPQRRRGAALEDAILQAAYDELSAAGYTAFSVEGVAARARTGKASIYRRWPTKPDLVWDALSAKLPSPADCGLSMQLAESQTTVDALYELARAIATVMSSPAGQVMRAIKCEAMADPELAHLVDERFQAPRRAAMLALLRRGVQRGEVRPAAVSELVADVLPAMLSHRVILQQERVGEAEIAQIMEQVFIPLVEAR